MPMDLDQQIQQLIDNAPADGTTPGMMAEIAPILKSLAEQLKHSQYYILQTLSSNWVLTTLSNSKQPDRQKTVIYAFPTLQDAANAPYAQQDPQVMAIPVPTSHILFQMVAMEPVDSLVFFEIPGNSDAGIEVRRADVQQLIEQSLQQIQPMDRPGSQNIPPNIA